MSSRKRDIFDLRDLARAGDYRNRRVAHDPHLRERVMFAMTKPETFEPECPKRLGHVPHHVDKFGVCAYCHHYVRVPSGK